VRVERTVPLGRRVILVASGRMETAGGTVLFASFTSNRDCHREFVPQPLAPPLSRPGVESRGWRSYNLPFGNCCRAGLYVVTIRIRMMTMSRRKFLGGVGATLAAPYIIPAAALGADGTTAPSNRIN